MVLNSILWFVFFWFPDIALTTGKWLTLHAGVISPFLFSWPCFCSPYSARCCVAFLMFPIPFYSVSSTDYSYGWNEKIQPGKMLNRNYSAKGWFYLVLIKEPAVEKTKFLQVISPSWTLATISSLNPTVGVEAGATRVKVRLDHVVFLCLLLLDGSAERLNQVNVRHLQDRKSVV